MKVVKEQNLNRLNSFKFLGFVNGNRQFVIAMDHAKFYQLEELPSLLLVGEGLSEGLPFLERVLIGIKNELIACSKELSENKDPEFKKGFNVLYTRIIEDPLYPGEKYILYYDLVIYVSLPYIYNSRPQAISSNGEMEEWLSKVLSNSNGLGPLEEHPIASYYPYYFVRAFTGGFKPFKVRTTRCVTDKERVFRI